MDTAYFTEKARELRQLAAWSREADTRRSLLGLAIEFERAAAGLAEDGDRPGGWRRRR
jgi:hypothetical protein